MPRREAVIFHLSGVFFVVKAMPNITQSNQDLAALFASATAGTLVYEKNTDTFWRYADFHWSPLDRTTMQQEASRFLSNKDPANRQTIGKLDDIVNQTKFHIVQVSDLDERFIAFDDFSLDTDDLSLHGHHRDRVATIRIRSPYPSIKSPTPTFDGYLDEVCIHEDGSPDPEMKLRLQETLGYILSPSTRAELCFFLYGVGGNGKSPFIDILRAVVGPTRSSASQLRRLTNDAFEMSKLVGKRLNATTELDNRGFESETFKNLVSGEFVSAQRKFGPPFDFKPRCKFVINTNNIPQFDGVNRSLSRRFVIIKFHKMIDPATKDVTLAHRIIRDELAGVVAWGLAGLKRLMSNNWCMTSSEEGDRAIREFEDASSSAIEFCRETYDLDANCRCPVAAMYADYRKWCVENGRKASAINRFGREAAHLFGKTNFYSNVKGITVRGYSCRPKDATQEIIRMKI